MSIIHRTPPKITVPTALLLVAAGVVVALTGAPLSGSTLLGMGLVVLGGWLLAETSMARVIAAHDAEVAAYVARVTAETEQRVHLARSRERQTVAAAEALVAYSRGASADEAMAAMRAEVAA